MLQHFGSNPKEDLFEEVCITIQERGSGNISRATTASKHVIVCTLRYYVDILSCIIQKKAGALGRRTNFTLWLCTDYSTVWKGLIQSFKAILINLILMNAKIIISIFLAVIQEREQNQTQ